jgi:hypothetical protein
MKIETCVTGHRHTHSCVDKQTNIQFTPRHEHTQGEGIEVITVDILTAQAREQAQLVKWCAQLRVELVVVCRGSCLKPAIQ